MLSSPGAHDVLGPTERSFPTATLGLLPGPVWPCLCSGRVVIITFGRGGKGYFRAYTPAGIYLGPGQLAMLGSGQPTRECPAVA